MNTRNFSQNKRNLIWRHRHPFRAKQMSYRSSTKCYINHYANHNDLMNLRDLVNRELAVRIG